MVKKNNNIYDTKSFGLSQRNTTNTNLNDKLYTTKINNENNNSNESTTNSYRMGGYIYCDNYYGEIK